MRDIAKCRFSRCVGQDSYTCVRGVCPFTGIPGQHDCECVPTEVVQEIRRREREAEIRMQKKLEAMALEQELIRKIIQDKQDKKDDAKRKKKAKEKAKPRGPILIPRYKANPNNMVDWKKYHRKIFIAYYIGEKMKDIARACGVSYSALRRYMNRYL